MDASTEDESAERMCAKLVNPERPSTGLGARRNLWAVSLIILVGTSASVAFHHVWSAMWKLPWPATTFLFDPTDIFRDFYNPYYWVQGFIAGRDTLMSYTPTMEALLAGLLWLKALWAMVLVSGVFLVVLVVMLWKYAVVQPLDTALRIQTVVIVGLLSYPTLFILDRANLDTIVFVVLALFFYLYYVRRSRWAGVILGLAGALKLYPIVLVLLPASDRKWRQALLAVASFAGFLALGVGASMVMAHRTMASVLGRFTFWLEFYQKTYVKDLVGVQHGHTIWGALAVIAKYLGVSSFLQETMNVYAGMAFVLLVLAAAYLFFVERVAWRKVALLILFWLFVPYISNDYTLVHLYFPLVMLLAAASDRRSDRVSAWLFALLFIPLDYYYFSVAGLPASTSTSVVLYPLIATLLAGVIVVSGLRYRFAHTSAWPGEPPGAGSGGSK